MDFVVEHIVRLSSGGEVVFARQVTPGDFKLSDGAALGGVPIQPYVTQPRALAPDGTPRLDLFAFIPAQASAESQLVVGQLATLEDGNAS